MSTYVSFAPPWGFVEVDDSIYPGKLSCSAGDGMCTLSGADSVLDFFRDWRAGVATGVSRQQALFHEQEEHQ
jgi:hypothetical protein